MIHNLRRRGRHDTNTAYFITQIAHASFSSLSERSGGASNLFTMKNLIFLTITILAMFSLGACHKEDPIFASCEGRILEKGSNKPIANAMIIVQSCIANVDKFSLSCAPIDTIYSDANGRYSYYLDEKGLAKHDGAGHIEFFATKARYFNQEFPAIISGKGAKNIDIILPPSAWLKLHVKAVNHYEFNDLIEIRGLYAGQPLLGGGLRA
jgi:hypothetical protein